MKYSFVTTSQVDANGNNRHSGYWYDPDEEEQKWRLVGVIKVPNENREFGTGGISAFIEQFSAVSSDELRGASYGPQFVETVNRQWVPITQAAFSTTSSEHPEVYVTAAVVDDGSRFAMGVAGTKRLSKDTAQGTTLALTNPSTAAHSVPLQEFVRLDARNTLPTGCTDSWRLSVCGGSSASPLIDALSFWVPTNLAKFVFELFIILMVLLCVCSALQCWDILGPSSLPAYSRACASSKTRSLVRSEEQ